MALTTDPTPVLLVRHDPLGSQLRVPDGVDVLEFSEFLESRSHCGIDYHPSDYVAYLQGLASAISRSESHWSDEDASAARTMFAESVLAIAARHGAAVLEWYHDALADAEEADDRLALEDLGDDFEFLEGVGFVDLAA